MRRLSIAVTVSMLLAPATSLAAYMSPSELFSALATQSATQNFSLTAHAHTNGAWVSAWVSGVSKGTAPAALKAKATIDVVYEGLKLRAKVESIVLGDSAYVRVMSLDQTYDNEWIAASGNMKLKTWIRMPLEEAMLTELTTGSPFSLDVGTDPASTDAMFVLQSTPGKNGATVYTLTLTPDYAVQVATMLREMLNDETPVSDDFFPFRQLADGLRYEGIVTMSSTNTLLGTSFEMSTASEGASLSVTGTSTATTGVVIAAPEKSVSFDDILASVFAGADSEEEMMSDDMMMYMEPSDEDSSFMMESGTDFNTIDENDSYGSSNVDCSDSSLSATELLSLQRDGTCPVQKITTRHGGW